MNSPRDWVWLPLLVCALYAPSLGASFQFDDFNVIVADPRVQSLAAWFDSMPAIRPVLRLSYALNHEVGTAPAGFRATNIAIHATSSVLVWHLFRRLASALGSPPARARRLAAITSLLFAVHPVQTEAVTYVSGRSSSLAALGALAALWLWVRADDATRGRWRRRGAALACAVLALGTKEIACALPLAMLAWIAVTPHGATAPDRRWVDVLAATTTLAGVALALGALTPYPALLRSSLALRTPLENLMTQAHAVPFLLSHLVRIDQLSADPRLAATVALDAATAVRIVLLGTVLAAALLKVRRAPSLAFGVLWCALWLLPTNSLFARDDPANDRQLYLACAGIAWLAAVALSSAGEWLARRSPTLGAAPATIALAGGLAVVLAVGTLARNRVYGSEIAYWEDAWHKAPENARAASNLGYAYALACRDADARRLFAIATRLDPTDSRARANRALMRRGVLVDPASRRCEPDG